MSKSTGLVFDQERTLVDPGAGPLLDRSRYGQAVADTDITYTRLPSGLYVVTHNGTSGYISLGSNASLQVSGDFTAIIWARIATKAITRRLFGNRDSAGLFPGWEAFITSSSGLFNCNFDAGAAAASCSGQSIDISDNAWRQFYVKRVGAALSVGLNASEEGTGTLAGDIASTAATEIGRTPQGSTSFWSGDTSLCKIWNYPLSATQIRKIFDAERDFFGV